MSERIAKASEQEIARQLDMQRQELLRINQKIEQGRIYRHDMHYHLSVLHNLAKNEKTEDIHEYISSLDILRQMEEQVAADEADYFIPGGIWSDEECFKEIEKDQNFYIDENNKLVIIFDEYEVAPGSMGMPQFTVESEILQTLLCRPFMLSTVGKETE